MRNILIVLFVVLSVGLFGQQDLGYASVIERTEGLQEHENTLFSVTFDYFQGEEAGTRFAGNSELFQLGFLVVTRKDSDIKSINIERLSVVSSTSFSTGIIYKVDPGEIKPLYDINDPIAFNEDGKLVLLILNDVDPGKEYYLNSMIDGNEINWHIDTIMAKAVEKNIGQDMTEYIDLMKKGLENKILNLENQLSITELQLNSLKDSDSDLKNTDSTHKVLLDQLEENIQALNIQFRKLNTLFLDSQLALGDFRGTNETKFREYEIRLEELNNTMIGFASSEETTQATVSMLEDDLGKLTMEVPEIKVDLETLKRQLNETLTGLQGLSKRLENTDEISESLELTNQASFTIVSDKIVELYSRLKVVEESLEGNTEVDPVLSLEVDELSTEVEDLLGQYKALTEVVISLTMDINTLKSANDGLDEELNGSLDELEVRINGILSEIESLKSPEVGRETNEASVTLLEKRLTGLNDEIAKLENLAAVFSISSTPEFVATFKEMGTSIEVLKIDFLELSGRIEELKGERESVQSETGEATIVLVDIYPLEIKIKDLGDKLVSVEENLAGLASNTFKNIMDLSKEIDGFDTKLNEVTGALEDDNGYEVLDERLVAVDNHLELVISMYGELENKIKGLESNRTDSDSQEAIKAELSEFEEELISLKDGLESIKNKQVELEKDNLDDSKRLESLSGNFEGAIMAMDGNLKMIRNLQTDLNEVRDSLVILNENMITLSEQKTEMNGDQLIQIEKQIALVESRNSLAIEETKREINSQVMIAIGAGLLGVLVGALGFLAK